MARFLVVPLFAQSRVLPAKTIDINNIRRSLFSSSCSLCAKEILVMEHTPPHFSDSLGSFAAHQPSNSIAMIKDENEDEDFTTSLSEFRKMCDEVFDETDEEGIIGGSTTYLNAPKMGYLRYAAELPLKLYNHTNSRSFDLVKVCKINMIACVYYAVTFKAKEGQRGKEHLFRGVVYIVGGSRAVYCEIKDDGEIKLLPNDNDYVGGLTGSRFRWLCDDDNGDLSPEAEFEELKAMVALTRLPWLQRF